MLSSVELVSSSLQRCNARHQSERAGHSDDIEGGRMTVKASHRRRRDMSVERGVGGQENVR